MDEYRDTTLHNADGTEDALRADMNDNAAPETADAAEPEILSAVADIASEEDETKDGAGPVRHRRTHRRRNIAIASVIAAVVVLAGGAGGYAYAASNVQKGVDAAQANAQAVDQKLTAKIGDAQELLDGTEEEQVADAQTLADLSDAIDKAQAQTGVDDTGANRWLVWQEMDAQAAYDADSADASDAMSRLDKAMDAVTGSMDAKTLADAKAALQSTVDSADKTYADSDGKVQDNATRDNLKTALDAAKKVLADDECDRREGVHRSEDRCGRRGEDGERLHRREGKGRRRSQSTGGSRGCCNGFVRCILRRILWRWQLVLRRFHRQWFDTQL